MTLDELQQAMERFDASLKELEATPQPASLMDLTQKPETARPALSQKQKTPPDPLKFEQR
ncbi:MAG: hypothetical protein A2V67_09550 [Deltaproteobacteria bacterium RBG_13_61_14]|nr:MAG: hypothetical protein A2V67_09550 [Deltaproteobacteria bacterium RBG_13_61_14]